MSDVRPGPETRIAYQGAPGAYSHQACLSFAPALEPTPFASFAEAFEAVAAGVCGQAMIPVHNSFAGPVPEAAALLASSGLVVVSEHELTIRLALMAAPGVAVGDVRRVASHPMALKQCAAFLRRNGWTAEPAFDTAGAAAELARAPVADLAVVGPAGTAALYGLRLLADGVEDQPGARTRFLVLSRPSALSSVRERIDRIDDQILDLLLSRMALAAQAGKAKTDDGDRIRLKADREHAILDRLRARAPDEAGLVEAVWREIVAGGLARQQTLSITVAGGSRDLHAWARDRFGSAPLHRSAADATAALEQAASGAVVAVLDLRGPLDWLHDFATRWPELWIFDLLRNAEGSGVAVAVGRVDPGSLAEGPLLWVGSEAHGETLARGDDAALTLQPDDGAPPSRADGHVGRVPAAWAT